MSAEGILLIDKPAEYTSFDVVARIRGMTKTKKVGHAGTLDPMATGVLPIFLGRATKACDILPNQDKTYLATVRLGISTDTQDITGTVLKQCSQIPSMLQVQEVLKEFVGVQQQLPPMYSAVQVDGRRLYDLARQGIEVERESREISIYEIAFLEGAGDTFVIKVSCSKGSYIRTLCHDIGERLGCGATLTALRRTVAAGFSIEQCITLEQAQELTEQGTLCQRFLPVGELFSQLPKLILTPKDANHYLNGVKMTAKRFGVDTSTGEIGVWDENNQLLGLSQVNNQGLLVSVKQFVVL